MSKKICNTMIKSVLIGIGASLYLISSSIAQAQSWPDKPVKLIIPFAAGGTTDILGRILAQQMTTILGQNVIVENKGGAGGNIGAEIVATSPPMATPYCLHQAVCQQSIHISIKTSSKLLYRSNLYHCRCWWPDVGFSKPKSASE